MRANRKDRFGPIGPKIEPDCHPRTGVSGSAPGRLAETRANPAA